MERHQDKGALGETRVGDIEVRLVEDEVSVEQNVEIEGARPIENAGGAVAAEFAFDVKESVEQGGGREIGFEGDDGVDKARLIGEADRLGGVKGGAAGDAADGRKAMDGCGKRVLRRAGRTRDVGAHPDVGCLHDSRVARWGGQP